MKDANIERKLVYEGDYTNSRYYDYECVGVVKKGVLYELDHFNVANWDIQKTKDVTKCAILQRPDVLADKKSKLINTTVSEDDRSLHISFDLYVPCAVSYFAGGLTLIDRVLYLKTGNNFSSNKNKQTLFWSFIVIGSAVQLGSTMLYLNDVHMYTYINTIKEFVKAGKGDIICILKDKWTLRDIKDTYQKLLPGVKYDLTRNYLKMTYQTFQEL